MTGLLLVLFAMHVFSLHTFSQALVLCYSEAGQIKMESVSQSFINFPSEIDAHQDASFSNTSMDLDTTHGHHADIPFSLLCSKDQQGSRLNQELFLKYLDGVVNTSLGELPASRQFLSNTAITPLIEDLTTTALQTVVLLN